MVEIMATGRCHAGAHSLGSFDSGGRFPSILGLEGDFPIVGLAPPAISPRNNRFGNDLSSGDGTRPMLTTYPCSSQELCF